MTITIPETGEVISHGAVRESIAIARSHGEKFFEQIVWQVENEVWTVLGYKNWDEMREAEYADLGVVAPRADRPELVSRLRAKGLTQNAIADTLGVNRKTVMGDLSKSETDIEPVTNSRGQQRPATYRKPEPEVVDAEIVDEPTPEPQPNRRDRIGQHTPEEQAILDAARRKAHTTPGERPRPNPIEFIASLDVALELTETGCDQVEAAIREDGQTLTPELAGRLHNLINRLTTLTES